MHQYANACMHAEMQTKATANAEGLPQATNIINASALQEKVRICI
jgi:hypothetical protein